MTMHNEENENLSDVRLLIVDDQPANLATLEAVLEPLGLTLVTASSGREALKHLLTDDFAAILLDVQMPGMDGFETAAVIKEREKSRYIPILFITALGGESAFAMQAYSSGAVDFIGKPFHPEILKSKVRVFVDLYRQRHKIARQAEMLREGERREAALQQEVREKEMLAAHAREVEGLMRRQRKFVRDILYSLTEGRLRLCDTPGDLPEPLPILRPPVPLTPPTLRLLRRQVAEYAEEVGWRIERLQDFETAVGEAAMNTVVHAGGGEGRVHGDPANGVVQVWVQDHGAGIAEESLHRSVLERGYTTAGTLGHGFYMMLSTADRVWLLTGKTGTTVVLEQGFEAPAPAWLKGL